jgi:hypothetical protein
MARCTSRKNRLRRVPAIKPFKNVTFAGSASVAGFAMCAGQPTGGSSARPGRPGGVFPKRTGLALGPVFGALRFPKANLRTPRAKVRATARIPHPPSYIRHLLPKRGSWKAAGGADGVHSPWGRLKIRSPIRRWRRCAGSRLARRRRSASSACACRGFQDKTSYAAAVSTGFGDSRRA